MNSGATSERVYASLKARLLGNAFPPGSRLDPTALAGDLASSVTPVRDALHLLTGERLVDTRSGEGFHMPQITGPGLEDLYAWSAETLLASLRRRVPVRRNDKNCSTPGQCIAQRTADIFGAIAARSTNGEHFWSVLSTGDRLHAARLIEPELIGDAGHELDAIEDASDDVPTLRKAIVTYHRRRRRAAFEIVRALYRTA
jgi:hypothetical protein